LKAAAIGIRAHSGWAAVVAVAGSLKAPHILLRERIVVIDGDGPRANQPYHFAKDLPLPRAKLHLAQCARTSRRLAAKGIEAMVDEVRREGHAALGCAVLTASGRALPALPEILASHPMIHTAEGELFRDAFVDACAELKLVVSKIRERDLLDRAVKDLRVTAASLRTRLTRIGRDLGPPWTQDQKSAALAAWLLLATAGEQRH
jgi:hypothetical protein